MDKVRSIVGLSFGILVAIGLVIVLFLGLYGGFMSLIFSNTNPLTLSKNTDHWTQSGCDRRERQSTASPDGSRKALMVDFDCGGFGMSNTMTAVAIMRQKDKWPDLHQEIFSSPDLFKRDDYAANLTWVDSRTLRITVPNDLDIWAYKALQDQVAIKIEFYPDDPVAREKILRERAEWRARLAQ